MFSNFEKLLFYMGKTTMNITDIERIEKQEDGYKVTTTGGSVFYKDLETGKKLFRIFNIYLAAKYQTADLKEVQQ